MGIQCGTCGFSVNGVTTYDREQALLAHQRQFHGARGMRIPDGQTTLDGGVVR